MPTKQYKRKDYHSVIFVEIRQKRNENELLNPNYLDGLLTLEYSTVKNILSFRYFSMIRPDRRFLSAVAVSNRMSIDPIKGSSHHPIGWKLKLLAVEDDGRWKI